MRLTKWTAGQFCADIDLAMQRPIIDLSYIEFVETYGLIYLCVFIRHHNENGKFFDIIEPTDQKVADYLHSRGFIEWIGPQSGKQEQHLRSSDSMAFDAVLNINNSRYIAEEIEDWIMSDLDQHPSFPSFNINTRLVAELAVELVDNFQQHSDEREAVCCLQLYPTLRRLDFAIGDCGIGIRKSLERESSHMDAALMALEDGVTRRDAGGFGLGTVRRNVETLGGTMFLSTGNAWIFFDAKSITNDRDDESSSVQVKSGELDHELTGVQIEVSIPPEVLK